MNSQENISSLLLEENIVGNMLVDKALQGYLRFINTEIFLDTRTNLAISTIKQMYLDKEKDISLYTVSAELVNKKLSEKVNIKDLAQYTVLAGKMPIYDKNQLFNIIQQLKKEYIKQKFISLQKSFIVRLEQGGDIFETLNLSTNSNQELLLMSNNTIMAGISVGDSYKELKQEVESLRESPDKPIGLLTGMDVLDQTIGAIQKGELMVIAAETSQGKSALALNIAYNNIRQGAKVYYFSLEMPHKSLTKRLCSVASDEKELNNKVFNKPLNDRVYEEFLSLENRIKDYGLYYDDCSSSNIEDILTKASLAKAKYGVNLVIIDYLQILSCNDKTNNQEQFLASVTRRLKNFALKEDITIIALSQVNRLPAGYSNSLNISRLRGSGQIAEAADYVLLLQRIFGSDRTYEPPYQNVDTSSTALIKLVKGRNCNLVEFIMGFYGDKTLFYNLDQNHLPSPMTRTILPEEKPIGIYDR